MQNRRSFIKNTISIAGAAGLAGIAGTATGASSTRTAFVFDAMGEIRDVYTPELLDEMLGSGLNAITKTMCDPKTFGRQALDVALEGIAVLMHGSMRMIRRS